MATIRIHYPPTLDGVLDIKVIEHKNEYAACYEFQFKHSKMNPDDDAWKTLVNAAQAIVAQDNRRNKL